MKRKIRKLLAGTVFVLSLCAILGGGQVQAASKPKTLCKNASNNVSFSADLTGNGKKDSIKLKLTKDKYHPPIKKVRVYVNGKKALTINDKAGSYSVDVHYIHMSKTKNFLQIQTTWNNGIHNVNNIYRYDSKKKKLVKVLDLSNEFARPGAAVKVKGSQVQIGYSYQPPETGWIHWNYTYIYKNGKFRLKSNTATVKSSLGNPSSRPDNYGKYFKKSQFVAAKPLSFYSSTDLKTVSLTAKRNDVLSLKKIKIVGRNMYLQFKKGNAAGWHKVHNGTSQWFYGVSSRLAG